jgi:hypothetical protein
MLILQKPMLMLMCSLVGINLMCMLILLVILGSHKMLMAWRSWQLRSFANITPRISKWSVVLEGSTTSMDPLVPGRVIRFPPLFPKHQTQVFAESM